jgi:2-amino-4-hydroxy-6-hydroxymethyldihydropteridine diphosphokinase
VAEIAYVALGSNLGDRHAHLAMATARLADLPQSRIIARSGIEETAAVTADGQPQPPYLNQMVALETSLTPYALLRELRAIEHAAGRVRERKWGPRTLDLDIVLFGAVQLTNAELTIPHPELANRTFWKRELMEMGVEL